MLICLNSLLLTVMYFKITKEYSRNGDDAMTDLNFQLIGQKIKERRKDLHITQEAIANYLDVNPSHISNIECGRANPSLTVLVKIANFLECSVDCFIGHEYIFDTAASQPTTLDDKIMEKLKYSSAEKKVKILQMMDIL